MDLSRPPWECTLSLPPFWSASEGTPAQAKRQQAAPTMANVMA